jgi:hypothetical protein
MMILGKSIISRLIEKQNVHGTGAPFGFKSTQCDTTDWVVLSNACDAKFSQYSTTDWFSNSCEDARSALEIDERGKRKKSKSGNLGHEAGGKQNMRPINLKQEGSGTRLTDLINELLSMPNCGCMLISWQSGVAGGRPPGIEQLILRPLSQ